MKRGGNVVKKEAKKNTKRIKRDKKGEVKKVQGYKGKK